MSLDLPNVVATKAGVSEALCGRESMSSSPVSSPKTVQDPRTGECPATGFGQVTLT